jgi:hypothetical protein
MNVPHKHAEIIKAWADGYQVEAYNPERDSWINVVEPGWFNDIEYRVKPGVIKTRDPVVLSYDVQVEKDPFDDDLIDFHNYSDTYNLRLMFVDEKLVGAFVIEDDEDELPW